jgi:FkbM family methyltransferase
MSFLRSAISVLSRSARRRVLEKTIVSNLSIAFCAPGDSVGRNVMASGTYEPEAIELLKSFGPGNVLLDIGANVGTHSIALCQTFRRVLAFEPNKALAHVIQANAIAANARNIEVFPVGLSDQTRSATLSFPRYNFSWGNLSGRSDWTAMDIALACGDDILSGALTSAETISLIKIDVEGHELAVLRGLTRTLLRDHPIIVYEGLSPQANANLQNFLLGTGYKSFKALNGAPKTSIAKLRWLFSDHSALIDATPDTVSHCMVAFA